MSATILLVEDDPAARLALSRTLESVGYLVQTASDGMSAIAALSRCTFDVVVSDMRLPDLDGVEVLQAASQLPYPPSVLLLTGYGTLDTAIAALRAGACDYLLKPCAPQVLLAAISSAVERRVALLSRADTLRGLAEGVAELQRQLYTIGSMPSFSPANLPPIDPERYTITIGHLQIGRFAHEARYKELPLHLTPIEHALLRSLAEAAGDVVSYSDIVRRTHGYAAPNTEAQALLKSHARNLRLKIGVDLIISVRNVGYRLATSGGEVADSTEQLD